MLCIGTPGNHGFVFFAEVKQLILSLEFAIPIARQTEREYEGIEVIELGNII